VKVAKGGRQSTLLARQGYYRALKWPPHHRIGDDEGHDDDNGLTGVGLVWYGWVSFALQGAVATAASEAAATSRHQQQSEEQQQHQQQRQQVRSGSQQKAGNRKCCKH